MYISQSLCTGHRDMRIPDCGNLVRSPDRRQPCRRITSRRTRKKLARTSRPPVGSSGRMFARLPRPWGRGKPQMFTSTTFRHPGVMVIPMKRISIFHSWQRFVMRTAHMLRILTINPHVQTTPKRTPKRIPPKHSAPWFRGSMLTEEESMSHSQA